MTKTDSRWYSRPLMKQNIRSNRGLTIVIIIVMILMSTVINYAMSMIDKRSNVITEEVETAKEDFYTYLFAMSTINQATGSKLDYEDFENAVDRTEYEKAFQMVSGQSDKIFTVEEFEHIIAVLETAEINIDNMIEQFEYSYALQQSKGIFTGNDLTMDKMMSVVLEASGVNSNLFENMNKIDTSSMINQMYYTVTGLLPILLYIVIVANGLIVNQIDQGSMAYVLSTPTRRSAIAITQAIFMIVVPFIMIGTTCISRIISNYVIYDDGYVIKTIWLYVGMYILIEAISGICYMSSCIFNYSRKATALGGGLAVWFFLASLLGMFGGDDLVDMGIGVEELGIFNKLTLIGLYDIKSISTIATENVNYSFVWKLVILVMIAISTYSIGAAWFQKKDLPL